MTVASDLECINQDALIHAFKSRSHTFPLHVIVRMNRTTGARLLPAKAETIPSFAGRNWHSQSSKQPSSTCKEHEVEAHNHW